MTLIKSMSVLSAALICATALFVSSCNDTTTTPTTFIPTPASGLQALSLNETTVRIMFTASPSESTSGFKDYFVTASVAGSVKASMSIATGKTSADIPGLVAGAQYTITLVARSTDSVSSPITITWSPATRYTGLKMYDRSSALGSGINLFNGTQQSISASSTWDLCFDSDNSAVGSPSLSAYKISTPKNTYFFAKADTTLYYISADSMNAVYETYALNDAANSGRKLKAQMLFDVSGKATKGFVCYCLTQDNYFAKIFVKAAGTGGAFIQSDANGKYVEIDASVQRTALIPYALQQKMGFDGPSIKATKIVTLNQN